MLDKRNKNHLWSFAAVSSLLVAVVCSGGWVPDHPVTYVIGTTALIAAKVINWIAVLTMATIFMTYRRVHRRAQKAKEAIEAGVPKADVIDSLSSPHLVKLAEFYNKTRHGYQTGQHLHPAVDIMLYGSMIYALGGHLATHWIHLILPFALCFAFLFDFYMRCEADENPALSFKRSPRPEQEQT